MKLLSKKINPETIKNLSVLMSSTIIATLIPILASPISTRLFNPASYGILGLYFSYSSLLSVFCFSHYPQAIILANNDKDAKNITWFSMFVGLLFSVFVLGVISIIHFSTNIIKNSDIGYWWFMLPLSLLLSCINTVLLLWANRVKEYKTVSSNRIVQAVLTVSIQLGTGFFIKNELGLMLGLLTGQLTSVVLLVNRYFNSRSETSLNKPDLSRFKNIAVKHKNLLYYVTPTEFINSFINQMPIFLLQRFTNTTVLGNFSFTQRILGLPSQFLTSAITDIFKQKASSQFNDTGNFRSIYIKTMKALFSVSIIPSVVLFIFGPQLFHIVFGEKWVVAGLFVRYLSLMFFLRLIVSPLSYAYYVVGKMREDLIIHIFFLVFLIGSFYIMNTYIADKNKFILLYSGIYSLMYVVYFIRTLSFTKINYKKLHV